MRAVMDRTLKLTRDGNRWRLCRRGCPARYRGVTWRLCLVRTAVQDHKTLPERHDPAPGRVAPDGTHDFRGVSRGVLPGSAGAIHLFRGAGTPHPKSYLI